MVILKLHHMKKIYTLIIVLLTVSQFQSAYAQCTPDQNIGNATLYPAVLPFATSGVQYNQVLTFRIPTDTIITFGAGNVNAHIDSTKLLYIKGMPAGFGKQCNPSNCTFNGGTLGCALLTGTADSTMIGSYTITLYVQTFFKVGGSPLNRIDSNSDYVFKIKSVGIYELINKNDIHPLKIYPNPSKGIASIELTDDMLNNYEVIVYDIFGKEVLTKHAVENTQLSNTIKFDFGELSKGLYIITVKSQNKIGTCRLIRE